jgi:hypothetical protein
MYKLSSDEAYALSAGIRVALEHLSPEQLEPICANGWDKATDLLMKEQDVPVSGDAERDLLRSKYAALKREAAFALWGQAMHKMGKKAEEVIGHGRY